ncbi:uncharacterized protein LOC111493213 [Cucurbita maxima]|uniref:Uncharacterized protein LOC111493213 n=1 Tax=Cucurbita maxima TaxID=3661 RepID=A0A6J1KHA3_CUCMA|nr:uncharacterized protein LOC111493213 [Cucurbita maxima]
MADNLISLESSITDDNNKNNNLVGNNGNNGVAPPKNTTTKKNKSLNILRVALMLLRRRSSKPNAASVEVASKGMWNRLVASIRPLHVQSNHSPQHPQPIIVPSFPDATLRTSPSIDCFEDVKSSSASSVDGMSRYASAINLQELDQNNEDDNDNDNEAEPKMDEDENADDMIDAKAEMFIAQFYEQIRRSNSDVRYREMIKRSIG